MPSPLLRKNDRREMRRALRLNCQVVRDRDFSLIAERSIDLSPDGMLVACDVGALQPGETVFVTFRATNLDIWFDSEATVRRIVRAKRHGDKGERAVGLEFTSMSRVKRFILRGHLRRVPPPVPRRTQRVDWTGTVERISG